MFRSHASAPRKRAALPAALRICLWGLLALVLAVAAYAAYVLLDLDRCYTVSRIPVDNGRQLVIYAVHLSAYGNSGAVRDGQKRMLREDMEREVKAGNYVICGGDFNHDLLAEEDVTGVESWAYPYPRSYLPQGMHFGLDLLSPAERASLAPTARDTDLPYDPEKSFCLTVDGFILSDNVEQVSYSTVDTQFAYSDHNPVQLTFRLSAD